MLLIESRLAYYLHEQPLGTRLYRMAEVACSLDVTGAIDVVTYWGSFGADSLKPVSLKTTYPVSSVMQLRRSKRVGIERVAAMKKDPLYKTTTRASKKHVSKPGWSSKVWFTGRTGVQKKSEEYPHELCALMAEIIMASAGDAVA